MPCSVASQRAIAYSAPSQAANSGREVNFETPRARALEGCVVWKNNVAAVFTNLPPVLKNLHHPESLSTPRYLSP